MTDNEQLMAAVMVEAGKIDAVMHNDLAGLRPQVDPLLAEVLEYGLFNGGKRIRPLLVVLSARLSGCRDERVYELARAFEYLHAATLFHDDVIDNAVTRRGRPAVNQKFGLISAILAGDYLHARSMEIVGELAGNEGLRIFCRATAGMVDGEFLQMRNAAEINLSERDYTEAIMGKTGLLIAASCEIGALYGGATTAQRLALRSYGTALGCAFQMIDDLLDFTGDQQKTGKMVGNDLAEGKMTLPLIHTLARADRADRQWLETVLRDRDLRHQQFQAVSDLIEKYDGYGETRRRAERAVREAVAVLAGFTGPGAENDVATLAALAGYVLTRKNSIDCRQDRGVNDENRTSTVSCGTERVRSRQPAGTDREKGGRRKRAYRLPGWWLRSRFSASCSLPWGPSAMSSFSGRFSPDHSLTGTTRTQGGESMKRLGLIGAGKHGSRYAAHIANDLEGFTLAGISRRSHEGIAQAAGWQTRYYPDWHDLVASGEVDAVVAVVVPSLHLEIAHHCAAYRKPLLLEKPLARNATEGAEIVRIMAAAECPLTVGQTLRYSPVIEALRHQLPQLGTLHSLAVNQRIEPSTLGWHDEPEIAGAGVIIHTAVHIFDALKVITGLRIRRVMAASRCVHSRRLEDLVTVLLEFENGVLGTLDVSKIGQARSGRYEFVCQEGQLHGDQVHGFTTIIRHSTVAAHEQLVQEPTVLRLLEAWSAFLETGHNNPVTGEDGLYAVRVCDACLQSAASRCWVEI